MYTEVRQILTQKYPEDLVNSLIESYTNLKNNFLINHFKASELEGGFFVESVRRIVEIELFGTFIPIGKNLNNFHDQELKRYEQGIGDESFRIHIPRVLKAIYNLRNKRGVGHLSKVNPNKMDAAFIISSCDWVLAELVRINSTLPEEECQLLITNLIQRKIPLIYENGVVQRVLLIKLSIEQKVMLLMYQNENKLSEEQLLLYTEYQNKTRFKNQILKKLHRERMIEYSSPLCELTPLGIKEAERILLENYDFTA